MGIPNLISLECSDWSQIYISPYISNRETKIQALQYKILHRVINCNYNLYKWKIIETSVCNYCKEEDTIMHYFIYCNKSRNLWFALFNWWNAIMDTKIDIHRSDLEENILFGFHAINNIFIILNFIILNAKLYIYRNHLDGNNRIVFVEFLQMLKQKILIEINYYRKSDDLEKIKLYEEIVINL